MRSNGYRNGEEITFSVTPNKDGYLKIFLFENAEEASQIFPNEDETNCKLSAKKTVSFPTRSDIDYSTEKKTDQKQEHNLLLFVYTKGDIPFYGSTTRKEILNWLNSIEPDQREVVRKIIMISE